MEGLYDDLENFNDVNLVNELRTENEQLKQKLGQYANSMETLQKDFDNLSAEFKTLETNYSSLLKSARAEIKRKTDMIKNLNIEKDMLVLKQFKDRPEDRRKLLNPYKVKNEGRVKKKNDVNKAEDLKKQDKFNRNDCDRPPSESSSTATEKSNKSLDAENRVRDSAKPTVRSTRKEKETSINEVFPSHKENYHDDRLQLGGATDRRLSTLASQPFLKFSSDEEFEDMYSALEPKTTSKGRPFEDEPQRSNKRVRDEVQHARAYESSVPQDKRFEYTDSPRDRYNKNRSRKFYENDRNMSREKHDLPHPHRNKQSPDRLRYGKREYGDDRFMQHDRHRWLESAPGDRFHHRNHECRPYLDRGRTKENPEMDRNNYTETYTGKRKLVNSTQIHGEYDQPLTKKFKGDEYPHIDEDKRRNDRHVPLKYHVFEMRDEIVNEVYKDLDKPTSGLAKLTSGVDDINRNQDANEGMDLITVGSHDTHSSNKYNVKDNPISKQSEEKRNEGSKVHKTLKYKIPLKKDKLNNYELSVAPRTKSNKIDTIIHCGKTTETSLPNKVVPLVNDGNKISQLDKIADSPELINNTELKSFPVKMSNILENKNEANTAIARELNLKISSIRNIVEGDLELSDETNDDTLALVKEKEQLDPKKKHKSKKKSRKDKKTHLEGRTRKTRSKTDKEKEVKPKSKFSELFGDSSSLITPEELGIASTLAPAQSAESYASVCEDAQDGIYLPKRKDILTLAARKEISTPDLNKICLQSDLLLEEENITKDPKDNKSNVHHSQQRKSEASMDDEKDVNKLLLFNVENPQTSDSITITLRSEEERVSKRTNEQFDLNNTEQKNKCDVLETLVMPEVQTAAPYKHCKDTLKVAKLDKKTRGDSVETLLISQLNTAVSYETSKEIYINKCNDLTQSDGLQAHLLKEKTLASREECTEIHTTDPNKETISHVEINITPEPRTVASSENIKEIINVPKPDETTRSELVDVCLMPEIKAPASNENSKETLKVSKPDKKTKSDVVGTHLSPELIEVASISELSKEICDKSKPDKNNKTEVVGVHLMHEVKPAELSEKDEKVFNVTNIDKSTKNEHIDKTPLIAEVKPVVTREKSKEARTVTKPEKKPKGDALKYGEKNKEHTKSSRKLKSNEGKTSEVLKETYTNKNQVIAEPNETVEASSNKENESCEKSSVGTVNNDMPKIFEDTLVPNEKTSICNNKTEEENSFVNAIPDESVSNTSIEDTPNLEAVTEDPGLVNTIVISSGIQSSDSNILQVNITGTHYPPPKALATSTPAKELSTTNTLSEIEPNINPLVSCVNLKTEKENPLPKYDESDIPDVRIYCYRRRRKVIK